MMARTLLRTLVAGTLAATTAPATVAAGSAQAQPARTRADFTHYRWFNGEVGRITRRIPVA
jgi:Spy/CpxP family protein refolding chaperone